MRLGFLSPDECAPEVALVSPLRHVSLGAVVTDVSGIGTLEVRGDIESLATVAGEHVLPLGPGRVLVVVHGSPGAARARLTASGYRVYDLTAALAVLEFEGEDLLRRLTDLEPGDLPATGAVARGTSALIEPLGGGRFRLYVAQELGHFVAEVVVDMAKGLGR